MSANREYSRLISLPHRVHWCGFVATTRDLQQVGWQISAEQDYGRMGVRLALRNEDEQQFAITNTVDASRLMQLDMDAADGRGYTRHIEGMRDPRILDFHVVRMSSQIHVRYYEEQGSPFLNFRPIDGYTQVMTGRVDSLEDLVIFAPPLVQTQELIVDEGQVSAILAKLAEAQRPEQERIRARQRLRESREGLELGAEPRRKFHAQILSIAA